MTRNAISREKPRRLVARQWQHRVGCLSAVAARSAVGANETSARRKRKSQTRPLSDITRTPDPTGQEVNSDLQGRSFLARGGTRVGSVMNAEINHSRTNSPVSGCKAARSNGVGGDGGHAGGDDDSRRNSRASNSRRSNLVSSSHRSNLVSSRRDHNTLEEVAALWQSPREAR